jgi:putative transposase
MKAGWVECDVNRVETPRRGVSTMHTKQKIKTMSEKFKNKYRIESSRLQGYDYSQNGMYFVTICTKDREEFFGEIVGGKMVLNDVGRIVMEEWLQTPIIRTNIILDEWIIMPNHLHGIIEIRNVDTSQGVETPQRETPQRGVSTDNNKRGGYNQSWKSNSLGSAINQIKSICTKKIWKSGHDNFHW